MLSPRPLIVRLTDEERQLAESCAKLHSLSIAEAFKRALFEKIEDEYDLAVGEAAYKKYLDNPKTYSHDAVLKMFGDDE